MRQAGRLSAFRNACAADVGAGMKSGIRAVREQPEYLYF